MSDNTGRVHSRGYDLAIAGPLAAFYAFAGIGSAILIARQWPELNQQWPKILNEALAILYFGLQAALFLLRDLPMAKSDGIAPRVVALLGANLNLVLLELPPANLGQVGLTISTSLTAAGTLGAIAILAWLGRGFAIFPEARRLVTTGPYRLVRHPLYLAELVSTLGVMLAYAQPWAALVVATAFAFQIARMHDEEAVLARAFPGHDAYRRKTARLIPGLY